MYDCPTILIRTIQQHGSEPQCLQQSKAMASGTNNVDSQLATRRTVDLAFAMDCTGSMASYIKQAQENIRKIAEEIVSKEQVDLRFALVEYRDHPPQESTFVTNVMDFTERLREMKNRLDQCSAVGGGDEPEAVADALHAVLKLSWRPEAVKICVFIADAPPHGLNVSGDGFPKGCPCGVDPMVTARELAEKEIAVYMVGCEPSITPYRDWFMAVSHITSGQYVPLLSAKLLSQVIVGGTLEEISLAGLMSTVQAEVERHVEKSGGSVDQEALEAQVYEKLKDIKTKSVTTDTGTLQKPSTEAVQLAELKTMAEVRGSFKTSTRCYESVARSSAVVPEASEGAASAAKPSYYAVVEGPYSKVQNVRLVSKCMASLKTKKCEELGPPSDQ